MKYANQPKPKQYRVNDEDGWVKPEDLLKELKLEEPIKESVETSTAAQTATEVDPNGKQIEDVESDDSGSGIDDEEVGGEWVTSENLYKHIGSAVTVPLEKDQARVDTRPTVQFVTSDYAMQNVIIQVGFKLLSLDGRRITRVKRFKLLCRACQRLNLNVEK